MKVFQIGFNKCGTSSIYHRLDALGFAATHIKTRDGRYVASVIKCNLDSGRHILSGLEAYDAFTDIEELREDAFIEGYKLYPQIQEQVPDARFILNVRARERWVHSRLDHNEGAYAEALLRLSALSNLDALADSWRRDWDAHVTSVKASIPSERLLVLDIEKDDPSKIDSFLGCKLVKPASDIPHNFTPSRVSRMASRTLPKAVRDILPGGIKRYGSYLLRKRR